MEQGGLSGAVLNAAKEVALEAFIAGRLPFLRMAEVVEKVMESMNTGSALDLASILEADTGARRNATEIIAKP